MTVFTTEELNLICIYDPGNRKGTIKELKNMMRYLMPDETELHDLAMRQWNSASVTANIIDARKYNK